MLEPGSDCCGRLRRSCVCLLVAISVIIGSPPVRAQLAPSAAEQIAALITDKAARTPQQRKLDSQLVYAEKERRRQPIALGKATEMKIDLERRADGRILIDLDATVTPALLAEIARLGGTVVASTPGFHQVRAALPLQQIEALAARGDVRFIRRASKWTTNAGSVVTQGDVTHRANLVRATTLATGRGVKVGVLSDSVDYLTNSMAQGELPEVKILPGQSGFPASGEGTAMLELIHDLAPDAELFFATANHGEGNFAQNILNLRAAGCDIIVDDVSYFSEAPFQDGIIARAVETVTAGGALYFSSAGNAGNKNDGTSGTWEGDFASGGLAVGPLNGKGGEVHSFGETTYNTVVYEGSGRGADLFWADPLGASTNDYDLYVLDATGTNVLRSSTNAQTGTQDAWESVDSLNAGERLVVVKASGAARFLHLGTRRGQLSVSTNGEITGHAAAAGALAVAAVDVGSSFPQPFSGGSANPVELFESDGPRRVFFQSDGTPITPGNFTVTGGLLRQKPDLSAADGGATSVSDRFEKFFGTSAAAPHAGAIAALVKSYNPALTPAQIRAALIAGCRDIEAVGIDEDSGVGLLDAIDAIAAAPAPPPAPAVPVIVGESMTLLVETSVNGRYDPGEFVTASFSLKNTGSMGANHLTATLLNEAGVAESGPAQDYGAMSAGSGSVSRPFSFRANGPSGGSSKARLRLNDGALSLGVVEFVFSLSADTSTEVEVSSYKTANAVTIPLSGTGTPYPATIPVSGFNGAISNVSVKIFGFTHPHPSDVQMLLVSPAGQKVVLMANAGAGIAVNNVFLGFDDVSGTLPYYSALTSSWSSPAAYGPAIFPAPAPSGLYSTRLAACNGWSPNGTWQLFVNDGTALNGGSIAGWSLSFKTDSIAPVTKTTTLVASGAITIPNSGNGSPYPSLLNVSNLSGTISKVTVNLSGFSHTYPNDVSVLLVNASTGQKVLLMAGVGTAASASHVNLTFDDEATNYLPYGMPLAGGSWIPTAYTTAALPAPAPGGIYDFQLSSLNGTDPNGQWQLYVSDNATPYSGSIASWSMAITTYDLGPVAQGTSDLSATFAASISALPGTNYTITGNLQNNGPNPCANAVAKYALPAGVSYVSATASQGTVSFADGIVTATLGSMAIGASATLNVTVLPGNVEYFTNTLDVTSGATDPNLTNNHAEAFVLVGTVDLVPYHHPDYSDTIVLYTDTEDDASVFTTADSVYVYPVVLNEGDVSASGGIKVELYLDDVLFDSRTRSAKLNGNYLYAPGFSVGPLSAGTHTLRMKIDPANSIAETNEANNEYTRTITVSGTNLPDLKPLDYKLYGYSDKFLFYTDTAGDVASFSSTDVITTYAGVINQGSQSAPASFSIEFYVDGVLNSTKTCSAPLNPGTAFEIPSFKIGPLTAGSHTLRVKVDAGNAATELDETNNEYTRTFNVIANTTAGSSLAIAPATLPTATLGALYHQVATITGGTAPYKSLTVTNFNGGTTGLTSDAVFTSAAAGTIRISGVPVALSTATFTITATDSANTTLVKNYTLSVGPAETGRAGSRLLGWGKNNAGQIGDNSILNRLLPTPAVATGVLAGRTVAALATGTAHSLALCTDGTLAAWGSNTHGELGNNSTTDSLVPIAVRTLGTPLAGRTVVAIAAGGNHNLALCSDGTLVAWGLNYYGQLGDGTTTARPMAVAVHTAGTALDGKTVIAIAAGTNHNLALCSDGTLAAWGYNFYGQLGNNATNTTAPYGSLLPLKVSTSNTAISGKTVVSITTGERHSMALCSDGTIAAWGRNRNGQLGDDSTQDRKVPVTVVKTGTPLSGKTITGIAAGAFHSMALCSDGTLATWGRNAEGQLGDGTLTDVDPFGKTKPSAVTTAGTPLLGRKVVSLIGGANHCLALCSDGTLTSWGDNDFGQLGNNTITANYQPSAVSATPLLPDERFVRIVGGPTVYHALLWTSVPVPEIAIFDGSGITGTERQSGIGSASFTGISTGSMSNTQTFTITNTGSANLSGISVTKAVTGNPDDFIVTAAGTTTLAPSATTTFTIKFSPTAGGARSAVVQINSNDADENPFLIHVTGTGTSVLANYTTGSEIPVTSNGYTARGKELLVTLNHNPVTGAELMVVQNTGLDFINGTFSNLAHGQRLGLTYGGVTYQFVANYFGGSGNDLVLIWANNRLFSWGRNDSGQLGNSSTGSNILQPTPVTATGVFAGRTVITTAAGQEHSLALCSDGTLAAWGANHHGQLGDGSLAPHNDAVAVDTQSESSALKGKTIIAVAAGSLHSLALCSDGSIIGWGSDQTGALGNGSGGIITTPVVVSTESGVSALFDKTVTAIAAAGNHSMALCTDGTVATWGRLGDDVATQSTYPVSVNTNQGASALFGKTVIAIAAGACHRLALCSDGTVAAWGQNNEGQLGNNTITDTLMPVAVNAVPGISALHGRTVISISACSATSMASCADGTVAVWGAGAAGQLGIGMVQTPNLRALVPLTVSVSSGLSSLFEKTVTAIGAGGMHLVAACTDGTLAAWGENTFGKIGDNTTTQRNLPVPVSRVRLSLGERFVRSYSGALADHNLAIVAAAPAPGIAISGNETVISDGDVTPVTTDHTDFSAVIPGASLTRTFTIQSTGSIPLKLTGTPRVAVTGPQASRFIVTQQPTSPLSAFNGTTTFQVTYTPNSTGINNATLTIENNDSSVGYAFDFSIRGTGVNSLLVRYDTGSEVPVSAGNYNAATSTVNFELNYAPAIGTELMVVNNTGLGFINGTFYNLDQGQLISLSFGGITYRFVANYFGGDGNDLVLTWASTRAFAWGGDGTGESGNPAPVQMTGALADQRIATIAAGHHQTLALCTDGTLIAWAAAWQNVDYVPTSPVRVDTTTALHGKKVIAIAAGDLHSLALCSDGTVVAWGNNLSGQLGDGTTTSRELPVAVSMSAGLSALFGKTVIAIAAGERHSLALCSDGTVAAWGGNDEGQLGDNMPGGNRTLPVAVNATSGISALYGKNVTAISAGFRHSLALCSDGTVATWGNDSTAPTRAAPVAVSTTSGVSALFGRLVIAIAAGGDHDLALCSDGTLVAWGDNTHGAIGDNTTISRGVPVAVNTDIGTSGLAGKTVTAIAAGRFHSLARCSDGSIVGWGQNTFRQLGDATAAQRNAPVPVDISRFSAGELFTGIFSGSNALSSFGMVASPTVPDVATLAATSATSTSARLNGTVNANGTDTSITFSYGLSPTYGSQTSGSPAMISGAAISPAGAEITGLTPGTRYHFRIQGGRGGNTGLTNGADMSFTTLSNNARLSGIALSAGTLSPAFASMTTSYAVTVPFQMSAIILSPATQQANAMVKVNDVALAPNGSSQAISLAVGSNIITTVVTAEDGSTAKTYTLTITRTSPEIEMVASGTSLADGGTFEFGRVPVLSSGNLIFTIRNTGNESLTLGTLSKSSDTGHAGLFSVGLPGSATLSPGATTTFNLQFNPNSPGVKTLALHLPSNDADEPIFDINIQATGRDTSPGTLKMGTTLVSVNESSAVASIPVIRTGGDFGSVSVRASTSNGTALAGSDYQAVSNASVIFADGVTEQWITINILNPPATNEANETFTVTLISTTGATLGSPTTATVRIIDSTDTTLPATPVISTPVANSLVGVNAGGTTTVTGTATDNKGIAKVEVKLGNGAYSEATLSNVVGTGASFSIQITPVTGANTVTVRSTDTKGNISPVATRNFIVTRPLLVNISGSGAVTAGFAPTSFREVGKSYTITASPSTLPAPGGQVFDGWSVSNGSIPVPALEPLKLIFTFTEGMELTARFIPNPFSPALAGTFNGFVLPSSTQPAPHGTAPGVTNIGLINLILTTKGSFTGSLKIDGASLPLPAGSFFDNSGVARFSTITRATTHTFLRSGKPDLVLALNLDMTPGTGRLSGNVTQKLAGVVQQVSEVNADRAHYSSINKVTPLLAGTTTKPYTLIFPARAQTPPKTLTSYPQGDGYANMTVNVNGTVSLTGKLADNTPFTASAPLSKLNQWPIFAQLYSLKGCFAGLATLTDADAGTSDVAATNLLWVRPPQNVQWYPLGWPAGIVVDLDGARYNVPPLTPAKSVFPGLNNTTPNATLEFFDGLLLAPVSKDITITTANLAPAIPNAVLTITKTSGLFTGTFPHSDLTKPAYQGVILQKGASRGGHGFFMSRSTPLTGAGESGRVEIRTK